MLVAICYPNDDNTCRYSIMRPDGGFVEAMMLVLLGCPPYAESCYSPFIVICSFLMFHSLLTGTLL